LPSRSTGFLKRSGREVVIGKQGAGTQTKTEQKKKKRMSDF
jgi:hypothetical protein